MDYERLEQNKLLLTRVYVHRLYVKMSWTLLGA